ncbi:hypothetical protein ACIOG4_28770 [Streptomyces microflavus]|uniref:hypothetical protein n=1 Tax=Streptomyces microflavus TaxID=1919 RepID=UPI00382FAA2A
MTATHVNGLAVIEDQPTRSGISRPGVEVVFDQTRHLLLSDGSEMYGCKHCTYTSANPNSIRPHLKVHKVDGPASHETGRKAAEPVKKRHKATTTSSNRHGVLRTTHRAAPSGVGPSDELMSMNVGQLVQRAEAAEQLRRERDSARADAEAAQRVAKDWKDRAGDYRARLEGMRERAERSEKRLAAMRALLR